MGHALDAGHHRLEERVVTPVGDEKLLPQGVVQLVVAAVEHLGVFIGLEYPVHQREAVSVDSAGGYTQEGIPLLDRRSVYEGPPFHDPTTNPARSKESP